MMKRRAWRRRGEDSGDITDAKHPVHPVPLCVLMSVWGFVTACIQPLPPVKRSAKQIWEREWEIKAPSSWQRERRREGGASEGSQCWWSSRWRRMEQHCCHIPLWVTGQAAGECQQTARTQREGTLLLLPWRSLLQARHLDSVAVATVR